MKKITACIIDDEISALKTLRGMLVNFCPQIEIIAVASSVGEAVKKVKECNPDLVFLDIEMPPFGSGFDFLKQCGQEEFGVIFTTAYPKYAIDAINKVQPWAYLVKPYSVHQLKAAIEIAEKKFFALDEMNRSLVISDSRKGNVVIRLRDIQFCKADTGTAEIHFWGKGKLNKIVASQNLKGIMEQLPDKFFCRCHHGYIVNFMAIERYEKTGRSGMAYLKNGVSVPVSVGKKEEFENGFNVFFRM